MLTRIATFEARYQLRAPLFVVGAAIFFLLTFGSVTVDEIQIGGKGNVNVNSPFAIIQTVGVMCLFALFIATGFVANVVVRDDETGFAPIIRATRITKREYLFGRFIGAFLVAALVLLAVPLGMLVGSWMPWLDHEKVGPFVASHYLYAYFVIGLPSLFVMAAGFFALATATRSMMWTYVGLVAFLTLYVTSRTLLRDPRYDTIAALSDPFFLSAVARATRYWTASDRNSSLPPFDALMLQSRLLWLTLAFASLGVAYGRFRFAEAGAREPASATLASEPQPSAAVGTGPLPAPRHERATSWRQFLAITRFDLRFVFKSPAFFVLLAIGVLNALGALQQTVSVRGVDYLPVTRAVVNMLTGAFTLIPIIIAVYYAGELVWRDHDRRMHEIIGATPTADWMFVLPKVLAITLVLASSYLAAVLMGLAFQAYHGYTHTELAHYLLWFVLPGTIDAVQIAMLAIFIQVVVPHKFMGWAAMLLYIVANVALASAGFEHNLYNFAGSPQVTLSDMNGLGRFWIGRAWFQAYWSMFSVMLLVLSHALWRRGTELPALASRLRLLRRRLAGPSGIVLGLSVAAFAAIGAHTYYNTNVLNRYRTKPERDRFQADYEKALLKYESVPQPRIIDVKLAVDLYPREAKAVTRGEYILENRTAAPLNAVHVRWETSRLKLDQLSIEGGRLAKAYREFHYRTYALDVPLQPGERRKLSFMTTLQQQGFPNSRPLQRIVDNGTFLDNFDLAPWLGIDRSVAMTDRAKRRKYGLPPDVRPPKLEDTAAAAYNYLRHDSDWVTAEITLTTDADQTPVAPGYAISDTIEAGRRTLRTRTEAPIMHFFSLQSARYAERHETWKSPGGDEVALAVYYHPAHAYNVQRMLDAMKLSLDIFTRSFSPYQFRQARILEFPAYAEFAQSFANTVPYSESIGFIQSDPEKSAKGDESIDLVTYVTAHEIAHQWWAHQVIGADKQGSTMLSESFAQYSAMLVMEQKYGPEMVRKFLKYELDAYLRSRGGEVVEELPLVRVENQGYIHYRKGTLVMYWLKESVGRRAVDRALQRLLETYAFKPAPYPASSAFVAYLREEAGPQWDTLITDLFEKITLYDLKARDASAKKRADGSYEVTFTIDAKKLYADGKGKETEAPLAEELEVGVFSAQPGKHGFSKDSVLRIERRALRSGAQRVTYVVTREPKWVGVDPYNKRIDRNSDDNLVAVDGHAG